MPSPETLFDRAVSGVPQGISAKTEDGHNQFWSMDTPERDVAGLVVRGGMWDHQREWWELPNFIKMMVGGYGSGKTFLLGKRAISLALANAPCPGAIVSPTYNMARNTTVSTIAELLQGKRTLLGRGFQWNYNQSSHEFTISWNGRNARFIIYSGDNPTRLKGPNLAWALIDEPFIQDEDVFEQMNFRVRHPNAKHKEIGLFGTPEQLNWGYELAEGELRDKYDVGLVRASTMQNLALTNDYSERMLRALDNKAAQAYLYGHFVSLSEGMVYYGFNRLTNVVDYSIPTGAQLGCGMDFNVNPMAMVVFWRKGNHIHIIDEYELPNADTEFACQTLREDYGTQLQDIYPDATGARRTTATPGGRSDFHFIRAAGFNIRARRENPLRKDRYNAVNGKLDPKKGKLSMTVAPKCKKLIKYFSSYSHELMNKQEDMSHLLDAATYPVAFLYPVDRRRFAIKGLKGT